MPAAIYAISYQVTGAILSYCQLKQRDLSPKGTVEALREELVGDNLFISLRKPGGSPLKIQRDHLRVDEVDIASTDFDTFIRAPSKFVLDLSDAGTTPGDGKKKRAIMPLAPGPTLTLNSEQVTPAIDKDTFVVSRPADFPSETELFVIIDGQEQSIKVAQPTNTVRFAFDSTKDVLYSVLFASRGVTPFFGLKKAV